MTTSGLQGKSVLITGGGRGLGRQMALDFAAAGAKICVSARSRDQIEGVVAEIAERGGNATSFAADVGVGADVARMVAKARAELGSIDILVNNAGSFPVGAVVDIDEDEWDRSMKVDLKSFYLCSRACLLDGGMLEAGRGHIINIGSVSVRRQVPGLSTHCTFKAGVLALSESMRREVASRGVRVSLICPGTINTDLVRDPEKKNYVHGEDKWLSTASVSDLVLYVASREPDVNISEATIVGT